MQMAETYRVLKPLSQIMTSQDSYECDDHNRNPHRAYDEIMRINPKRFPICDKCKLQRTQRFTEPPATVENPSETCLSESDPEWLSPGDSLSSMKLLSMLMLNAWRQRRKEVKELQQVLENIKDENMKYKNQMHVYSTLVRVEQKRNDELTLQLKLSIESVNQVRYSCDSLTSSVLNLTADKEQLRQELENRKQQYEAQKSMLKQTKSDLLRSICEQRDLQARLSKEQRAFEEADQHHKHVLERLKSLLNMDDRIRKSEEDYYQELKKRENTIKEMCSDVLMLREKVRRYEEEKDHRQSHINSKRNMSESMVNMNAEIISLKAQLEEQTKVMYSFVIANGNKHTSSRSWETMLQSFALKCVNVVLYLLPAMPTSTKDENNFYNVDNKINPMDNKMQTIQAVKN